MTLNLLLAWWNLIYVIPFLLAITYLGLFVFTGITFGDADASFDHDIAPEASVHVAGHVVVDTDVDADTDADASVHADHDQEFSSARVPGATALLHSAEATTEHGTDHDADHDVDHGTPSTLSAILSLLGVGKIPFSLALMILFLLWGFIGFALNAFLISWLGPVMWIGFVTAPITAIISLAFTGLCAALIGKVIPISDGPSQRRKDLVGRAGEALYDITADFGMAQVRSASGDLIQVPCKTRPGVAPIPKGSRVVLFDYDHEKGVFHVAPFGV